MKLNSLVLRVASEDSFDARFKLMMNPAESPRVPFEVWCHRHMKQLANAPASAQVSNDRGISLHWPASAILCFSDINTGQRVSFIDSPLVKQGGLDGVCGAGRVDVDGYAAERSWSGDGVSHWFRCGLTFELSRH